MSSDLDLTQFFKEGSGSGPSKLDWLDVNEKDYQALDRLPKQNLDITPDLKALWSHEDKPSTSFIPNTGDAPRTMGDMSQLHGPLRRAPEDLIKTARLAVMQTTDPQKIHHTITSRFDGSMIRAAKVELSEVFAERGLLGRFYVDAADFGDCHTGSKKASEFVRRFAGEARFVKAKTACGGCIHRQATGHCGVFHKQIVLDVPYTDELAAQVESMQQAKGRPVQASEGVDPKTRIRNAFVGGAPSTPQAAGFSGRSQQAQKPIESKVSTADQLIAVSNLTKKREVEAQQKVAAQQARPIVAMLKREMLKGRSKGELSQALRLAFDERDLRSAQAAWSPVYKEAGLYGALYTTQDSFEDCREGAGFLAKHGSMAKAVVAGEKCGSCIFNKVGRCLMYGKPLLKTAEDLYTPEMVRQVLDEHKMAGRLPFGAEHMDWGADPATQLRNIHEAAMSPKPVLASGVRGTIERAFTGGGQQSFETSEVTKNEIVKAARQYLNEGLYGTDLAAVMRSRFEVRDLAATRNELRLAFAEQGLQGIKYIDPTVYDDYGKGCKTAERLHRSRSGVKYAKVGSKCDSCVHQTRPGHCSVIGKQLVVEPPYVDKVAEQRAVLASGRSTEVPFHALMNNGLSMMHEFELQAPSSTIDLSPEPVNIQANIEFGNQKVDL